MRSQLLKCEVGNHLEEAKTFKRNFTDSDHCVIDNGLILTPLLVRYIVEAFAKKYIQYPFVATTIKVREISLGR